jgi:hypothetical protein
MAMTGVNEPPLSGMIRMLRRPVPEFLVVPLFTQDRTLSEWFTLCDKYENYKECRQREYTEGDQYNPFFHSAATGRLLRQEIFQQLQIRRIIRIWISRLRIRLYRRRLVGETDLLSLEPIGDRDAVEVVCHSTKSIYRFHVNTLSRMIQENLYFQQWGHADPMDPRNPYTNQPWKFHQLIEIIHRIQDVLTLRRNHIPSVLSRFVEARYIVDKFYTQNRLGLGIRATSQFFKTPESHGTRLEILHELFIQINKRHKYALYKMIQQRQCLPILQHQWETLIQNRWMHDNYGYSPAYMWRDSLEQMITIQQIYHRTLQWQSGVERSLEEPSSEEDGRPDSQ